MKVAILRVDKVLVSQLFIVSNYQKWERYQEKVGVNKWQRWFEIRVEPIVGYLRPYLYHIQVKQSIIANKVYFRGLNNLLENRYLRELDGRQPRGLVDQSGVRVPQELPQVADRAYLPELFLPQKKDPLIAPLYSFSELYLILYGLLTLGCFRQKLVTFSHIDSSLGLSLELPRLRFQI